MNTLGRILEACGNANCAKVDAYHRRIERIGVISEMLFTEVVRDNHKDYPPRIDADLAAVEEQAERNVTAIGTARTSTDIPF